MREIVEVKHFHPAVGKFVTAEEYEALRVLGEQGAKRDVENCYKEMEARFEGRSEEKSVASHQAIQKLKATAAAKKEEAKAETLKHFTGRVLKVVTDKNVKNKETRLYKSLQIILDKKELTFQEYTELGGDIADLKWAVKVGKVITREP